MKKQFKLNYIVIPAITIVVMILGKFFSSSGMDWYYTIIRPDFTPPGWFIGFMWQVIFLCTTLSVFIAWNTFKRDDDFWKIIYLFIFNATFNVAWTFLFFYNGLIGLALVDAILILLTVLALIFLMFKRSRAAALLLLPYGIWVSFAIVLNTLIFLQN